MDTHVYRSFQEAKREGISQDEAWHGTDDGLITAWEVGRDLAKKKPELSIRAKNGELPYSNWKGGIAKETKVKEKFGTLWYLAEWQGLRGEDLDIDLESEPRLTCSRTATTVVFTGDVKKYGSA